MCSAPAACWPGSWPRSRRISSRGSSGINMLTIGASQIKLLERLCNALSVSGDEGEVRRIVLEEVKPYADEVKVDALGSVLVRKKSALRKPLRVLLDAHMDEVGFMIVNDEEDGFFRFEVLGGIDERHLVGKQVMVGRD